VSASYLGVLETCFQFVLYEDLKKAIRERRAWMQEAAAANVDVAPHEYFLAFGLSKLTSLGAGLLARGGAHSPARTRHPALSWRLALLLGRWQERGCGWS